MHRPPRVLKDNNPSKRYVKRAALYAPITKKHQYFIVDYRLTTEPDFSTEWLMKLGNWRNVVTLHLTNYYK